MTRRIGVSVLVLSVFVLILLAACGVSINPILGEWQANAPAITLKFFQDGTVVLKQDGRTFTGQYKSLDSENIRLDMQGDLGLSSLVLESLKITGDTFTATLNGQQVTFNRTGASSPQGSSSVQVTPASQTPSIAQADFNSTKILIGKWKLEQSQSPTDNYIAEFELEADGTIRLLIIDPTDGHKTGNGEVVVQPAGEGKFVGYLATQGGAHLALEFDILNNGQRMNWKQKNGVNDEWHTGVFVRADATK